MSSPIVDNVRNIPLRVDCDIPSEYTNTGYPFDRESDSDGYLRSQLDDIAKRHPEIAEHLENFGHRDRQRSTSSTEPSAHTSRRFPRQFSERFQRFGFPFDADDFEPDYYQHQQEFEDPRRSAQAYTQEQQTNQPQQQPQSSVNPNYQEPSDNQQSSDTVDHKQQQEAANDRNQRCMSAPPSENAGHQTENPENMSQSHPETKSSNERIIPIHIEGRDEPVLPRNVPPSFSQHQQTGPQPERIFGKPTEQFTQFLPHERETRFGNNWHHPGYMPEEPVRQQRFQPQQSGPVPQQKSASQPSEIPIPVQREGPPKQQTEPQPRCASPQEQPKPKVLTPLEQIQAIQKDVSALMGQVEAFPGKTKDKQYLYLDEMLTRNLIKLDNIDTHGQDAIRSARKEAIKCIEKAISVLEAKATSSSEEPKEEVKMEVDENPLAPENENKEAEQMEAEPIIEAKENATVETKEDDKPVAEPEVKKEETDCENAVNSEEPATKPEVSEAKVDDKTETELDKPDSTNQPKEEAASVAPVPTMEETEKDSADKKEKKKGKKKVDKKAK